MESLLDLGHDLIVTMQAWRHPILDQIFLFFTFLGSEEFLIALLLLLWWMLDKQVAQRILPLALVAIWASLWAKVILGQPRPFDPAVVVLVEETTFGLPSTHSVIGVVVWGFLAWHVRHRWAYWSAAALAVAIGVSRIYLGVHFPHDVIGGWLLGLGFLWLFTVALPRVQPVLARLSLSGQVALGLVLPLSMLLLFSDDADARAVTGMLAGAAVAIPFEHRWVGFQARTGNIGQKAVRLLLGIIGVGLIRWGLKALLPEAEWSDLLRYALLGMWVAGIALWLFATLQLAPPLRRRLDAIRS